MAQSYVLAHDWALWFLVASGLSIAGLNLVRGLRKSGRTENPENRNSNKILIVGMVVTPFLGFSFLYLRKFTISVSSFWFYVVGMALTWTGEAFRGYAVHHLGKYFSFDLEIQSDHEVVDTGPYRYVRNPSHTGAMVTFIGMGIALGNWLSLAVMTIGMGAAYTYQIEEAVLWENLREEYESYMDETPYRLFPYVW